MTSVFISHKRREADNEIALLLADDLEKLGFSVYLDLNRPRAMEIDKEISASLNNADFVIAIISGAADDSNWVKGELKRAANLYREYRHPRIVPIRLNFKGDYSPRLAAILDAFDPIYTSGNKDPNLLPQVRSALGLGPPPRFIVTPKRSNTRLKIFGLIGLSLILIFIAYWRLAGSREGSSLSINHQDEVAPQESESPLRKTAAPNAASSPNSAESSEEPMPVSLSAGLLNELMAAHNQTRIGSSESEEQARQLYRDTLHKLPSAIRASLSSTCAGLLSGAEADYQENNGAAALTKYDSFFTTCIAH